MKKISIVIFVGFLINQVTTAQNAKPYQTGILQKIDDQKAKLKKCYLGYRKMNMYELENIFAVQANPNLFENKNEEEKANIKYQILQNLGSSINKDMQFYVSEKKSISMTFQEMEGFSKYNIFFIKSDKKIEESFVKNRRNEKVLSICKVYKWADNGQTFLNPSNQLIVKPANSLSTDKFKEILKQYNLEIQEQLNVMGEVYILNCPPSVDALELSVLLSENKQAEYAEPNFIMFLSPK